MSPPGYQAPVVKANPYGNERLERSDRRKAGRRKVVETIKKSLEGSIANNVFQEVHLDRYV